MKRLAILILSLAGMGLAHAEGHNKMAVPDNVKWKTECGSCHIAYPPKLLTADNWRKLMGGLNKHFGANAELDAKDNQDILAFLERNAGSGERYSAASLRITDTPWFRREHREVSPNEWVHPQVKSRSNCSACHQNVARNIWSERDIRMPGGRRMGDDDDD
ncbi:MAG TPA: diheme cytochrome c [Gallionella sp.]|nr:diheme cytochrome c [Gallionella sp.]